MVTAGAVYRGERVEILGAVHISTYSRASSPEMHLIESQIIPPLISQGELLFISHKYFKDFISAHFSPGIFCTEWKLN